MATTSRLINNSFKMSARTRNIDTLHPFLRWAGGKTWLVKLINNGLNINTFSSYHEPFVGGGAMLFHLQPKKAYISDSNEQLIRTYEAVRDDIDEIITMIKNFGRDEQAYYQVRSINSNDSTIQAAQFIYLNQMSFNGIYRVNLKGEYNVPWGKRVSYKFDYENLKKVSSYLRTVRIQAMDFGDSIKSVRKNTLVFLDPPYTHSKIENRFIKYNQKIFTFEDQKRLSLMIDTIKSRGAYYILTNADHALIKEVFDKNDRIIPLSRKSTIGGMNAQRGQYEECIFTNTNLKI